MRNICRHLASIVTRLFSRKAVQDLPVIVWLLSDSMQATLGQAFIALFYPKICFDVTSSERNKYVCQRLWLFNKAAASETSSGKGVHQEAQVQILVADAWVHEELSKINLRARHVSTAAAREDNEVCESSTRSLVSSDGVMEWLQFSCRSLRCWMEGHQQCFIDLMTPHTLIEPYPLRTTAAQQFELLFNFSMGGNGVWMLCRDLKGVLVLISAFLLEYDMFLIFVSARRCRLKRTFENLKIYMDRGQRNHLSFTSS